jgi:hypothetical protein
MKPKIALAKYLDWAILAVLAAALLFIAVRSFVLKSTGEEDLNRDIGKYDQTVTKWMNDTSAKPTPPRDYLGELKNRFEHPAVIDPYRRNPFLTREDIPYPPLLLRVGMPFTKKFKGTRFTAVIEGDEKNVHVELAYDLPTGVSTVTFTPLQKSDTTIRIQTDEDLVHRFQVNVRIKPNPIEPNPPVNVVVVPRAAIEIRKIVQPAMVLISFLPDNPKEPSPTVGYSNNADVYRKPAGASDAEYVRLNDDPLLPLTREEIHNIMQAFQIQEPVADQPTPGAMSPAAGAEPGAPPVPEAVTTIRLPGTTGAEQTGEPVTGSFVFLDQTVDDGENYVYKIVTLSKAPEADIEPVPCKQPFVTAPISVASLVEFTVRAISTDRVTVSVIRRDPDTGEWLMPQDFTLGVGMKIGGKVTLKLPEVIGLPPKTKDVDFSTGCILVNTLPAFQIVDYPRPPAGLVMSHVGTTWTVVYKPKVVRDPRILYLTPRGALHFKSKEK